jgi:hypothetical protein
MSLVRKKRFSPSDLPLMSSGPVLLKDGIDFCGTSVLGAEGETADVYKSPIGIGLLTFAVLWFSLGAVSIWRMLNSVKGISKKGSKK